MILCITREWIMGMVATDYLLAPGLLVLRAIYRAIGGTMRDTVFAYIAALTPLIFIDVAIYTVIFFGLARLTRVIVLKRAASGQPTTDNERPTAVL